MSSSAQTISGAPGDLSARTARTVVRDRARVFSNILRSGEGDGSGFDGVIEESFTGLSERMVHVLVPMPEWEGSCC